MRGRKRKAVFAAFREIPLDLHAQTFGRHSQGERMNLFRRFKRDLVRRGMLKELPCITTGTMPETSDALSTSSETAASDRPEATSE